MKVNRSHEENWLEERSSQFPFANCFRNFNSNFSFGSVIIRLLVFEWEGVLNLKKVQNNRSLVQRDHWSWRIRLFSRIPENITGNDKNIAENDSLNSNFALLYKGVARGVLWCPWPPPPFALLNLVSLKFGFYKTNISSLASIGAILILGRSLKDNFFSYRQLTSLYLFFSTKISRE